MMIRKKMYGTVFAASFFLAVPVPVFAQQSPEFAYSAEKWATLRDNVLEYDEIADLVHEYNTTVLQNAISYRDEKEKTVGDVAQEYYDAANTIYGNLTYPDEDSDNFGAGLASYLSNKQRAESLMEQGDKSTDNAETIKLGYEQTEASLVKQAQETMISYYSRLISLDSLQAALRQAQANLESEQTKLTAGTSTQSAVLSAKQRVSSAQASLHAARSSLEKAKEDLILMLGWPYGADVTIGELPEPDLDAIAAIDLNADITAAQANNYTLKKTALQLANARSSSGKESLTETRNKAESTIANSVSNSYQNLMLALSDYEQARQSFTVQQTAMASADRKKLAGTISDNSYTSTEISYETAAAAVRTGKLALLTAYVDYTWAVNGLATAS